MIDALIVEPGIGIGPFKLGMSKDEIAALGYDTDKLGIECWCDEKDICNKILVRVYNNATDVFLQQHRLNDIDCEPARRLFTELFGDGPALFGAPDRPAFGIDSCVWEMSDHWVYAVAVFAPKSE